MKMRIAVFGLIAMLVFGWAWDRTRLTSDLSEVYAAEDAALDSIAYLAEQLVERAVRERELRDSIAAAEPEIRYIEVEADAADAAAEATATNLREHLEAREDSVGLVLWQEDATARAVKDSVHVEQLGARDRLIAQQRQLIGLLEADKEDLAGQVEHYRSLAGTWKAEAEQWYREANPPFAVRLFKDGWKVAAGVAGGYLIGSL